MQLSGNKILITGATSGIGLAFLEAFLEKDNQIIALGRNEKMLKGLAQKDTRIIPFACDLNCKTALDELVLFIEQKHPDLNILINNAGIQYNYHFLEEPHLTNKIVQEININLSVPIQIIGLLLPTVEQNENAAIVNVSSGLALASKKSAPVYSGTKAGIHIFSQALRYQLNNVKVFEIIPPLVETAMTAGRGKNKISPQQLAKEFIQAFQKNNFEINIGKVKWLKIIQRISPTIANNIMKGS